MGKNKKQFASDNYAGMCPEVLEAISKSNSNHVGSYGDDQWTEKACNTIRKIFDTDCHVYFVFNGTGANAISLSALCNSYNSVICHKYSHINCDECGAPQFFTPGLKILTSEEQNGKITLKSIEQLYSYRTDMHFNKPSAVSITESTETGLVYSPKEISSIGDFCKDHSLYLHMDGARFANAIASLQCEPKDVTWKAGVDILSLGGTKNGIGIGDAVVIFNDTVAKDFEYRCKQAAQLASKMRIISASWDALMSNDTWLKNGRHANSMARLMESKITELNLAPIVYPVEANALFLDVSRETISKMGEKGWTIYQLADGYGRIMFSWDTTEEDVHSFVNDLQDIYRE